MATKPAGNRTESRSNARTERSKARTESRSNARTESRSNARTETRGGGAEIKAKNVNAEDRKYLQKHGDQLSKSTLRAKWIHSPDEHQDRSGQTLATRSGDVIKAWAEARRGVPATVARKDGERPRTLRFDFPAGGQGNRSSSRRLEPIRWDEWLRTFEERDLVFLFQEELRDGRQSNFFRLDNPRRSDA